MKRLIAATLCMIAAPALAQAGPQDATTYPCDDATRADVIAEPWEQNTATYADGRIRVTLLDYIEPAGAAMKLLILSPPHDEIGRRQCRIVGVPDRQGFYGIDFGKRQAEYDPATGLTLTIPVRQYPTENDQGEDGGWFQLGITIDQKTGDIALQEVR
ncbi:hypothetical protein Q0601_09740 [Paracoccus onubensis]|uniref:hypothetical protein n=1 Tax=Paracoccus onubensis TaxID=1675788 RepID=UPI00272F7D53|nr:hypothetical protein [Paracoccus onubensis]MDP0927451.1 hypothetical protein [Paracoccus onubensis]